ncbi:hypothetical protein OSB04_028871 [Centaurea solstitialis]|uniref:Uncharacterized protein n=1 Tax=Centaurea solstitialis TaxID=347529 RepID=A0AA38SU25_9ASTR|nr:hypothetical protein OSB04_028871 [Centaurea solstitialis]
MLDLQQAEILKAVSSWSDTIVLFNASKPVSGAQQLVKRAKESETFPLIVCCVFSEGLVEPFAEPERELKKKKKKKSKARKARPRALNFDMGEEAPMWNTRRTSPTVPTQPITKPNLETEIKDC